MMADTDKSVTEIVTGNNKLRLADVNANTIGDATPANAIASISKTRGLQFPVSNPSSTLVFIFSNFKNLSASLKEPPSLYKFSDNFFPSINFIA